MNTSEENYWTNRYKNANIGWDVGQASTPIKAYINQLKNKDLKILIPGAGNAYEAEYIYDQGFKNVYILDISEVPLDAFKKRNPNFPEAQIIHGDFFEHAETYDLIIEQTFFCSFLPTFANRLAYAQQIFKLLKPKGKLVGLWFDIPLTKDQEKRPFGGNKALYLDYFKSFFKTKTMSRCYNSIIERTDKELFGIFEKRV